MGLIFLMLIWKFGYYMLILIYVDTGGRSPWLQQSMLLILYLETLVPCPSYYSNRVNSVSHLHGRISRQILRLIIPYHPA